MYKTPVLDARLLLTTAPLPAYRDGGVRDREGAIEAAIRTILGR